MSYKRMRDDVTEVRKIIHVVYDENLDVLSKDSMIFLCETEL